LFLFISYSRGEAINIELNVPITVQYSIAKVNHLIVSGQNIKIAIKTSTIVNEVNKLLLIVSVTDKSITSSRLNLCLNISVRLDLILSNTTIVSFIDIQSIVSRAVIKNVSTLN
jgi:hypothetical protein